jgi:hypothetical protein
MREVEQGEPLSAKMSAGVGKVLPTYELRANSLFRSASRVIP